MRRSIPTLLLGLGLTTLSAAACGTTPGAPATATLVLAPSSPTFTTSTGWSITLAEAWLVPSALYVYAPDGDTMAALSRVLLPVAHAHGGHDPFGARAVRLEWLGPRALDLFDVGRPEIGALDGSVGPTSDATLAFGPLPDDRAAGSGPSRGHHVFVAGTATREGEAIAFEGGLDLEGGGTERLIEAIAIDAMVESEGELAMTVDLARWLDEAQLDRLPVAEVRLLAPGSQPAIAWSLGLRDPRGYALTYDPRTMQ
jgi:hypothetical protein